MEVLSLEIGAGWVCLGEDVYTFRFKISHTLLKKCFSRLKKIGPHACKTPLLVLVLKRTLIAIALPQTAMRKCRCGPLTYLSLFPFYHHDGGGFLWLGLFLEFLYSFVFTER